MTEIRLTPMQQKLMNLLGDEQRHSIAEIIERVFTKEDTANNVQYTVSMLRKAIRPKGMDVACIMLGRETFYQLARLTANPYDGRR